MALWQPHLGSCSLNDRKRRANFDINKTDMLLSEPGETRQLKVAVTVFSTFNSQDKFMCEKWGLGRSHVRLSTHLGVQD